MGLGQERRAETADLKTKENTASVAAFINAIENETKRQDCRKILTLMKNVTQKKPKMWGTNMVGFGRYHYSYASGREGKLFVIGFSPRKQYISIYIMPGFSKFDSLTKKLGKHKTGSCCLYIKRLDDVDLRILEKLVTSSVKYMHNMYKCT